MPSVTSGHGKQAEGIVMKNALDGAVTRWLGEHREEFVNDLLALLAIPSVKGEPAPGRPYGKAVGDALDLMLSLCRRAGLTVADVDGCCGEADFGDGEKTVGVLTHLDVVPAGEGWTRGVWGEAAGDRIYGRAPPTTKGQPWLACTRCGRSSRPARRSKTACGFFSGATRKPAWATCATTWPAGKPPTTPSPPTPLFRLSTPRKASCRARFTPISRNPRHSCR